MDKEIRKRIIESVDSLEDELVKTVSDLVKIKSVTPEFNWNIEETLNGETKVNQYTQKIMDEMGLKTDLFSVENDRYNLVGIFESRDKGKSLLFNGHVDVVSPGDENEWKHDPFGGIVKDGFIHGRGTVDMKGNNAAAVFALKAILKAGLKPKGNIIFQNVIGEEVKNNEAGTTACLKKGYIADAAICCEPTCNENNEFEINPASSGIFEMKWKVKGKSCHAGLRREVIRDGGVGSKIGVDAIEKGLIVYNAIKELEEQWGQSKHHHLYKPGNFCINGATIKAGTAPSFVPDSMEMSYSIFYPPQDSPEDVKKEVENMIYYSCQKDPWLRDNPPEIEWIFNWPSFDVNIEEEICKVVQEQTKEISKNSGDIKGMFAVCDASFIKEEDIPVVVLGAGNTGYTHAVDEKIAISNLMDICKIYALIIAQWCGIE